MLCGLIYMVTTFSYLIGTLEQYTPCDLDWPHNFIWQLARLFLAWTYLATHIDITYDNRRKLRWWIDFAGKDVWETDDIEFLLSLQLITSATCWLRYSVLCSIFVSSCVLPCHLRCLVCYGCAYDMVGIKAWRLFVIFLVSSLCHILLSLLTSDSLSWYVLFDLLKTLYCRLVSSYIGHSVHLLWQVLEYIMWSK